MFRRVRSGFGEPHAFDHNSMTIDRSTLGFGARKRTQVELSYANLLITVRPLSENCGNTIRDLSPDSHRGLSVTLSTESGRKHCYSSQVVRVGIPSFSEGVFFSS